jgi:hypothetical protein
MATSAHLLAAQRPLGDVGGGTEQDDTNITCSADQSAAAAPSGAHGAAAPSGAHGAALIANRCADAVGHQFGKVSGTFKSIARGNGLQRVDAAKWDTNSILAGDIKNAVAAFNLVLDAAAKAAIDSVAGVIADITGPVDGPVDDKSPAFGRTIKLLHKAIEILRQNILSRRTDRWPHGRETLGYVACLPLFFGIDGATWSDMESTDCCGPMAACGPEASGSNAIDWFAAAVVGDPDGTAAVVLRTALYAAYGERAVGVVRGPNGVSVAGGPCDMTNAFDILDAMVDDVGTAKEMWVTNMQALAATFRYGQSCRWAGPEAPMNQVVDVCVRSVTAGEKVAAVTLADALKRAGARIECVDEASVRAAERLKANVCGRTRWRHVACSSIPSAMSETLAGCPKFEARRDLTNRIHRARNRITLRLCEDDRTARTAFGSRVREIICRCTAVPAQVSQVNFAVSDALDTHAATKSGIAAVRAQVAAFSAIVAQCCAVPACAKCGDMAVCAQCAVGQLCQTCSSAPLICAECPAGVHSTAMLAALAAFVATVDPILVSAESLQDCVDKRTQRCFSYGMLTLDDHIFAQSFDSSMQRDADSMSVATLEARFAKAADLAERGRQMVEAQQADIEPIRTLQAALAAAVGQFAAAVAAANAAFVARLPEAAMPAN